MFLPVRMANDLRTISIPDTSGTRIPLVRSESALFTAGRQPEPSEPPSYLPLYVAVGILIVACYGSWKLANVEADVFFGMFTTDPRLVRAELYCVRLRLQAKRRTVLRVEKAGA